MFGGTLRRIVTLCSNPNTKGISVLGEKSGLDQFLVDELIFSLSTNLEHRHPVLITVLLGSSPGVQVIPPIQTEVKTVAAELCHVKNTEIIDFLLANKAQLFHLISCLPESGFIVGVHQGASG